MVLRRHDDPAPARLGYDRPSVERLDDWRIDDRGDDAVLFQCAPRRQRGRDHHASRDDQRIAASAPAQDLRSGKIEAVVGLKDNRRFTALKAHINGPKMVGDQVYRLGDLKRVGGLDNRHARERAHQRNIVDRLVAGSSGTRQPRHEADDLDVQPGIGDRHRDLIVASARAEDSERVDENDMARSREACGDSDHVRFSRPDVDEALADRVAEHVGLGLTREVGPKTNDLRVSTRDRQQRLAVRLQDRLVRRIKQETPPVPHSWRAPGQRRAS